MRSQLGIITLSWMTTLLAGSFACSGQGSKPVDENDASAAGGNRRPITVTGCVEQSAAGYYTVRRASPDGNADPGLSTKSSDGVPNSGRMIGEASRGKMRSEGNASTPTESRAGTSSAANGPWPGTGTYRLATDPQSRTPTDLSTLVGSLVTVTGTVSAPPGVRAAGTDQMQAAQGAIFKELAATVVTPLGRPCGAAAGRQH
jgi:hypothetical protein